jgi:small subunit ribosomal protein S23
VGLRSRRGADDLERQEELDKGTIAARKRWKAIADKTGWQGEWSRGQEYVRLWREGVRPTYMSALTEPIVATQDRKSF